MTTSDNDTQMILGKEIAPAFSSPKGMEELKAFLRKTATEELPDASTKKGRTRIASLAHMVARSKTLVDDYGKDLVAAEKRRLALIDVERKNWRDFCDALKEEVRRPLTEWEQAEEKRKDAILSRLADLEASTCTTDLSSIEIQGVIQWVESVPLDDTWEEFLADAAKAKDRVLLVLRDRLQKQQAYEDEQEELARLREEKARRDKEEHERKIAEEAARKAKEEAEAAARKVQEREEAKRREAEAAARKAKEEAEAARRREEESERRRVAAEAEAKRIQEAAEAQVKEARLRAVEAERARVRKLEEEARARDEKLAKNAAHQRTIAEEIVEDLVKTNFCVPGAAKKLVQLIQKGVIRHVHIQY